MIPELIAFFVSFHVSLATEFFPALLFFTLLIYWAFLLLPALSLFFPLYVSGFRTSAPSQPLRSGAEKGSVERGLSEPLLLHGEFRSALLGEHRKAPALAGTGPGCVSFAYFLFAQAKKSKSPCGRNLTLASSAACRARMRD